MALLICSLVEINNNPGWETSMGMKIAFRLTELLHKQAQ
jgi:hypothetical protein